ncbi:hypothetical protein Tco_1075965 [Tanacetum coccineum]
MEIPNRCKSIYSGSDTRTPFLALFHSLSIQLKSFNALCQQAPSPVEKPSQCPGRILPDPFGKGLALIHSEGIGRKVNYGCEEEIEEMLPIKVYAQREEMRRRYLNLKLGCERLVLDDYLGKKVIKFRLGRGHLMIMVEFAPVLGLYSQEEIDDEAFVICFRSKVRNDSGFRDEAYWLRISTEESLRLSRSK